ncbi:MAG: ketopantoate reductase family protein [Anaerolineae bacterium]|jgi:2-dehydropantoate 2-reductase
MQEIKRVIILGAGAMGAFFASRFFEAPGFETALLARGERHRRLQRDGLVVNGVHQAIPVVHPDRAPWTADLVIVALKHHHLPIAVPDLRGVVGDGTTLVSVMNGLDSEETLAAAYGSEKVLYATSVGIDAQRQGNQISYSAPGKHYVGQARNDTISPQVRRVQAAFERAGIVYVTPPDMIRILWWKFMINVGMNQASAVMNAPYGTFQAHPAAQAVMETLMREVIALAEVLGVDLGPQDVDDWYPVLQTLSPQGKTSMLQDIAAGRKTEVEMFAGKVVELGREHNVPTPANRLMLDIIHVLEQGAA